MAEPSDQVFWSEEAIRRERAQLATVQKSAAAWGALLTAVLGVFGTAAFAGGITSLDKIESPWDTIAKVATLAGAGLLLGAIWMSSRAASNLSPAWKNAAAWKVLESEHERMTEEALDRFNIAKFLSFFAALVILAGTAGVLLLGEAPDDPGKPPTVVAIIGGTAVCGKLEVSNGSLTVDGNSLQNVSSLTIIGTCP